MMYKVSMPGGRWKYGFKSIEDANVYAQLILSRTGVFVTIVAYQPRRRTV